MDRHSVRGGRHGSIATIGGLSATDDLTTLWRTPNGHLEEGVSGAAAGKGMLMAALAPRRSFTAAEYHLMAEAGIFTEDDRIELIEGEIVEMTAIGALHVNCVNALNALLHRAVGHDVTISIQNPVHLLFDTEPEPDVVLVPASPDRRRIFTATDVLLLIEVADSSVAYDRGTKLPLYAGAGVRESWIVDLIGETIERHTEPQAEGYHRVARAGRGEALTSTVLPAVRLDVNDVLGEKGDG